VNGAAAATGRNDMLPVIYINTALGSCFIIILISIDYIRKYNTDAFQRKVFLAVLGAAFIAVLTDFTSRFLAGRPGHTVQTVMYLSITLFMSAQNVAYYLSAVFINYFAFKNIERAKRFIKAVVIFLALHFVSLMVNLPLGFYFSVPSNNIYTPGPLYGFRLIISYFAIVLIFIDVLASIKRFTKAQVSLIVFFSFLSGSGAALDVLLKAGSLTWPCFAAALLYLYFFIIKTDSKIDSLTGIGNRYSFNEFIDKLSRQNTKESFSIVMIDMDHFKEINDTLGHIEGDNALRDMAAIIKGCIRYSDFAARYGGDEFVLAVSVEYDIRRLMNRIRQAIDFQNEKHVRPYQIEMSYGCDVFTTNSGQSIHEFLEHIDKLMYKNKQEKKLAAKIPHYS
jgi:diguanylate cyclase (GGDEF)-like protein